MPDEFKKATRMLIAVGVAAVFVLSGTVALIAGFPDVSIVLSAIGVVVGVANVVYFFVG